MPRIIKPLPPDHPIFTLGPSFVLRQPELEEHCADDDGDDHVVVDES